MLEREVTRSDVASPLIHSRENMCWSCRPGRWMKGGREKVVEMGLLKPRQGCHSAGCTTAPHRETKGEG